MNMKIEKDFIEGLYEALPEETRHYLDIAIEKIVEAKRRGGKVVVVVGGLLGVAGRLSGTVSPFRAEQGTSLETTSRARDSEWRAKLA